jgi:hypothetical protein
MNNLDKISESGITRRYWKSFCKEYGCASNKLIASKNEMFGIAFRAAKRGENWRSSYDCFLIKNLNDKGREMLPKLP